MFIFWIGDSQTPIGYTVTGLGKHFLEVIRRGPSHVRRPTQSPVARQHPCTVSGSGSGSASVICEAGGTVTLLPGFHASGGTRASTFDAFIIRQPVAPAFTSPAAGASQDTSVVLSISNCTLHALAYLNLLTGEREEVTPG
jgi:hypothetical protein